MEFKEAVEELKTELTILSLDNKIDIFEYDEIDASSMFVVYLNGNAFFSFLL